MSYIVKADWGGGAQYRTPHGWTSLKWLALKYASRDDAIAVVTALHEMWKRKHYVRTAVVEPVDFVEDF